MAVLGDMPFTSTEAVTGLRSAMFLTSGAAIPVKIKQNNIINIFYAWLAECPLMEGIHLKIIPHIEDQSMYHFYLFYLFKQG